jgi:hypothetical protein
MGVGRGPLRENLDPTEDRAVTVVDVSFRGMV